MFRITKDVDMKENKINVLCIILTIAALVIAFIMELYIKPVYLIKCIVKVSTFGGIIVLYAALTKNKFKEIINFHKPEKIAILIASILVFFVGIGILFFIFKNQIEWGGIRESLTTKEGFTKENCFFGFAYIIIFNSFLEEAFYRGFFPRLISNKVVGYIISALLFSIYHIGIIGSWFNIPIFIICVVGLAIVGLFLQWISIRYKTIVANWMVHASANIAINIIGTLLLFGILN